MAFALVKEGPDDLIRIYDRSWKEFGSKANPHQLIDQYAHFHDVVQVHKNADEEMRINHIICEETREATRQAKEEKRKRKEELEKEHGIGERNVFDCYAPSEKHISSKPRKESK